MVQNVSGHFQNVARTQVFHAVPEPLAQPFQNVPSLGSVSNCALGTVLANAGTPTTHTPFHTSASLLDDVCLSQAPVGVTKTIDWNG